jgi:N-acetylmuramoyl-L-alanine amidase
MKNFLGISLLGFSVLLVGATVRAESKKLIVAYPPDNHKTDTDRMAFLGSAPANGNVLFNGQPVKRNRSGNFALSFPLKIGENIFTISYQGQTIQRKVTRTSKQLIIPPGQVFAKESLWPAVDIAKQPGDKVCFGATALPNTTIAVKLGNQTIPLALQPPQAELRDSKAVLTGRNQPLDPSSLSKYAGCTTLSLGSQSQNLELGKPEFQFINNGRQITQVGNGAVTVLSPDRSQVAEVKETAGVARTGASTDFSRLTPLPKGTRAAIIGQQGDWFQLDYGGWIKKSEVTLLPIGTIAPQTTIHGVSYRQQPDRIEMTFPLETAVPVTVQNGLQSLTLTLHNTTAQTDIIRFDDNPLVARMDWQQVAPGKVQYTFHFKKSQQWGYQIRYDFVSPEAASINGQQKPAAAGY